MTPLAHKRILVTGGGGFLGRHLLAELRRVGCRDISAPRQAECDLACPGAAARLVSRVEPELVIHLAAAVGGIGANQKNPGAFLYRNLIMGAELIEASRKAGVGKFVLIGTTCSYPRSAPLPLAEASLWDGYPEPTTAPYGLAKRVLMAQSAAYRQQYGFNGVNLILTNLYGPEDSVDLQNSHVVPAMIRKCVDAQMRRARVLQLWGTGRATRDFLYITDAAQAIRLAAERLETDEPVNLGSGVETSTAALASLIATKVGFEGEIRFDPNHPDGHPRRYLDTTRCEDLLGFKPEVDLTQGLDLTIAWYRSLLTRAAA